MRASIKKAQFNPSMHSDMPSDDLSNANNRIMPEVPEEVMTIKTTPQQPVQAVPHASSIESFVKKNTDEANTRQTLTVSFTVLPKSSELKGVKLMEAVLKACGEVGADMANFSIRKDDKK